MKYLIDTNILIDALRKKPAAKEFLKKCAQKKMPSISHITLTEIMAGCSPEMKEKVHHFLDQFEKIPVNEDIALYTGELLFEYARKGRTMSFQDATLAATCLTMGITLATANVKDFEFIEGLDLQKFPT